MRRMRRMRRAGRMGRGEERGHALAPVGAGDVADGGVSDVVARRRGARGEGVGQRGAEGDESDGDDLLMQADGAAEEVGEVSDERGDETNDAEGRRGGEEGRREEAGRREEEVRRETVSGGSSANSLEPVCARKNHQEARRPVSE